MFKFKRKIVFILLVCITFLTFYGTKVNAQSPGGVGYTFHQTLPDMALAQGIAEHVGKSANDVITESDIDMIWSLSLSWRGIFDLTGIDHFRNIVDLDLSGNPLNQYSWRSGAFANLNQLDNLSILNLSSCQLTEFPQIGANYSILDVSNNYIDLLPLELMGHHNIVNCIGNGGYVIGKLPKNSHITDLELSGNTIGTHDPVERSEILNSLFSAPNLHLLDISGLGINELPNNIPYNNTLMSLDLSNNNLYALPESINNLKQLKLLRLNRNKLTEIPLSVLKNTSCTTDVEFNDALLGSKSIQQSERISHSLLIPRLMEDLISIYPEYSNTLRFKIMQQGKPNLILNSSELDNFTFDNVGTCDIYVYFSGKPSNQKGFSMYCSGFTWTVEVSPLAQKDQIYKFDIDNYSGLINSEENTITFSIPSNKIVNGAYSGLIANLEADGVSLITNENNLISTKSQGDSIKLTSGMKVYINDSRIYTINIDMVEVPIEYPEWNSKSYYHVGDIVIYEGVLYKSLVNFQGYGDMTWNPKQEPTLWRRV